MKNIISIFIKILVIVLIMQIIFMLSNTSHAGIWDDIISSGNNFLNRGKKTVEEGKLELEAPDNPSNPTPYIGLPNEGDIKTIISEIYNILFPLGIVITVAVGGVLGIKFMMASAEDKAKVKESMLPYVVGCAVIFGTFAIWKTAVTIFSSLA